MQAKLPKHQAVSIRYLVACALLFALPAHAHQPNPWNEDALGLAKTINDQYAYLERLPGGRFELPPKLQEAAGKVGDESTLLDFAEKALFLLADHHAITGSSFDDSWAVVPAYSMLWIERIGGEYRITSVRKGSPAETANIARGDLLVAVGSTKIEAAVASFWADLGVDRIDDDRAAFAARILAAGRRNAGVELTIANAAGISRKLALPSLYASKDMPRGVRTSLTGSEQLIEINDVLGEISTIAEFDRAMAALDPEKPLLIDLTNTPSGGNTVIARAILGWFVDKPTLYQIHRSPAEERRTSIPRQWVEQVLPRPGKRFTGPVTVRVGRWTGSMGEGLAVGFNALGARVEGEPMAGLLGAIEDVRLPNSGLVVKIPSERLYTVGGTPREQFRPHRREIEK